MNARKLVWLPVTWCYRCAWDHSQPLLPEYSEAVRCEQHRHDQAPQPLTVAVAYAEIRAARAIAGGEDVGDPWEIDPDLLAAVAEQLAERAELIRRRRRRELSGGAA